MVDISIARLALVVAHSSDCREQLSGKISSLRVMLRRLLAGLWIMGQVRHGNQSPPASASRDVLFLPVRGFGRIRWAGGLTLEVSRHTIDSFFRCNLGWDDHLRPKD